MYLQFFFHKINMTYIFFLEKLSTYLSLQFQRKYLTFAFCIQHKKNVNYARIYE